MRTRKYIHMPVIYKTGTVIDHRINLSWQRLVFWWAEFRRPKCRYCGVTVPKGEYVCDSEECWDLHSTWHMAP
jgi:hypothetical protein